MMEMVMNSISNSAMPRQAHAGNSFQAAGKTARNWWVAYTNWRLEQFAIKRLRSLSDRELKDIGIPRAAIEALVRGRDRHPMLDGTH
jgi:uncharacterized protein YjiS (DUF1127 family)